MARPITSTIPTEHCAYCDAPLPPEPSPGPARGETPRYCCYGCRLLGESGQRPVPDLETGHAGWFRVAVGAAIAGQAMLLSLGVNLAPPAGPTRGLLHAALIVSCLVVSAVLGGPLLREAREALRERRISIELLFLAGIGGAFFASLQATLTGHGAIYYEVVAILLTVYAVGKTLGAQSRARALAESRYLREAFATCQKLEANGQIRQVSVSEIVAGDRVRVLPGEAIPIDGQITAGQAFVRETPLTGEPFPVVRHVGDRLCAGSYSEDGELVIAATVSGRQRQLDQLLTTVELARERPSCIQTQADQLVRWFLPLVLLVATGTFVFWTVKGNASAGLYNALAVLLVACPCAMGLATPIALWNGLAVLAARGFVAHSGEVIDRLAALTHIVFDKTGTLSEEAHSLIDLATAPGEDRVALQELLAAVQSCSTHPVARAFQGLASAPQPDTPAAPGDGSSEGAPRVKSLKAVPAHGVEAWVELGDGRELHVRLGERAFMPEHSTENELLRSLRHAPLDQLVYVAVDGRLVAVAAVRERLRSTTHEAVAALESLGLDCAVMTGDQPARALALGVRDVQTRLTPTEKAAQVQARRNLGQNVGFVGDGVNDAPALRSATVGIALAHGAALTTANADAILYGGDLRAVPWAIALCRQVRAAIRSNLFFAAVYNLSGMALAAAGLLHPVAAALLMVLSSFTVSWRALRSTDTAGLCCGASFKSGLLEPGRKPRLVHTVEERAGETRKLPPRPPTPNMESRRPSPWPSPLGGEREYRRTRWGIFMLSRLQPDSRTPFGDERADRRTVWDLLMFLRFRQEDGTPHRSGEIVPLAYGILLALQIPFLIYFGKLSPTASVLAALIDLGLAWSMVRFRARSSEAQHFARMTFAMLSLGNWGMLLGWWVDAGFGPASVGCPHCAPSLSLALTGIVRMPWMNLGMLLCGLPPMLASPTAARRGLGHIPLALLAAAGMVLGMGLGSFFFLTVFGPATPQRFLVSFVGMTWGMLLGMFFFCELGRALTLWWRGHRPAARRRARDDGPL